MKPLGSVIAELEECFLNILGEPREDESPLELTVGDGKEIAEWLWMLHDLREGG